MTNPFLSRKTATLLTATLMGLLLLFPAEDGKQNSALLSTAEAGFFSNDLELFEEVVDLVGDKYVYLPDYKKMFTASVEEMVRTLDDENIIMSDTPDGQAISRFDSSIRYHLNFNREHDLEDFKKIYYFLHGESKNKL
ncbi:MAG: peptidase S41, partial [Nitrospinaceae bacterium]|nr:peptidase S41 [Nitrospinaceae bacterium]